MAAWLRSGAGGAVGAPVHYSTILPSSQDHTQGTCSQKHIYYLTKQINPAQAGPIKNRRHIGILSGNMLLGFKSILSKRLGKNTWVDLFLFDLILTTCEGGRSPGPA